MKYADVYLPVPKDGSFTYIIPEQMNIVPGVRVVVPFGRRNLMGFVANTHNNKPQGFALKEIAENLDEAPIFGEALMALATYVARTYIATMGEVYAMALPGSGSGESRYKKPFDSQPYDFSLNEEQQRIFDAIIGGDKKEHLIFGVTGSGKTELYMALAREVIKGGGSVIYLVPEITLSSQVYQRLDRVFGDDLTVYHSGLSPNQRIDHWRAFYRGEKKIVIGTRSSIFMQAPKVGLIIIDEEHDSSFKENSTPRYNAKRLALFRSHHEGAYVVMGSATPSLESYYASLSGLLTLHTLKSRFGGAGLPDIDIVDISEDDSGISSKLRVLTTEAIRRKEQVVYLLNRRGYSPVMMCGECKKRVECPDCSVTLNLHNDGLLKCHYCGYSVARVDSCPNCGSKDFITIGTGTQRLEEQVEKIFPTYKVYRMDRDSTKRKKDIYDIISMMDKGEIDLLVGTQMIAKGFDFQNISLVGILMADIGLNLPDFRATERIFSLLTQVAGRCGRGEVKGRVVVQTLDPEHYLFDFVKKQDYRGFFEREIALRKMMFYPPFARLVRIVIRGKDEAKVSKHAATVGTFLNAQNNPEIVQLLGPSPAPFTKMGGNYRYHIILKCTKITKVQGLLFETRWKFSVPDLYLEFDIDPADLL